MDFGQWNPPRRRVVVELWSGAIYGEGSVEWLSCRAMDNPKLSMGPSTWRCAIGQFSAWLVCWLARRRRRRRRRASTVASRSGQVPDTEAHEYYRMPKRSPQNMSIIEA